ncbi:hypothetical protein J2T13_004382 [Paenibacillus sp. DS2015]
MKGKLKSEEGSFTVEASLVMPIVLMVTLILMFFCLYIYQQSILQQVASAAVERSAYSWDNSHKNASNGSFAKGNYDSLYWRLSDDQMLGAIFGWAGIGNTATLDLPGNDSNGSLTSMKLSKISPMITGSMQGGISYQNTLLLRKVSTQLNQIIHLSPLDKLLAGGSSVEVSANAIVVDPVEFIRTVDLMRYYGAKFKGVGGQSTSKSNAAQVLTKYGATGK